MDVKKNTGDYGGSTSIGTIGMFLIFFTFLTFLPFLPISNAYAAPQMADYCCLPKFIKNLPLI